MSTLTLDEALKLFEMPRNLGDFEGSEVTVAIGRFGPYVKHAGKFVSIPKDVSPESITLDEACQLIADKRAAEAQRVIKEFTEEPGLQVLNGRYGPYISYNKKNFKLPKGTDAATLTLDDCRAIVAEEANATKSSARRATRKSTTATAAKKPAAKKKATTRKKAAATK